MRKLILAAAGAAIACHALAQPRPAQTTVHHGGPTLFVAQAEGAKTVPPSNSAATATGAFLVDPQRRTMRYDFTFHGLERGAPKTIALYNFGPGRNGERVHVMCGAGASACPDAASGNVTGTWEGRIDNRLLGEIASSRIYVQVDGGDGRAELRAQLEPNSAMVPVRNFAAHLVSAAGVESRGVGTAFYSEVHFAGGRVAVVYQVTVANTKGEPRSVLLRAAESSVLPGARLLKSRNAAESGGTIRGSFEVASGGNKALLASSREAQSTLVVTTAGFPNGELSGVLDPVN